VIILKWFTKNKMGGRGVDLRGLGYKPLTESYESRNKIKVP
jgi:hypothetical protein